MKGKLVAASIWALLWAGSVLAYEHKLQFSPYIPYNPVVGRATVIGEQFTLNASGQINGVTGLIHFVTVPSGCRYVCPRTNHDWTGTWDLDGNLLGTTQVAWTPQSQIGTGSSNTPVPARTNNELIYAHGVLANGNTVTAGEDTALYGYVDTVQSHYVWSQTTVPPENVSGHFYIPRTPPFVFSVSLTSDGDLPLNITSTILQVTVSGGYTNGTGTASYQPQAGDCVSGPVAPGTACSIQIGFDPSTIISSGSPYGYAYNNLFLSLASDAGNLPDWTVSFTISGFTPPDE